MSVTKDEFIQLQKSVARRETRRLWVVFVVSVGTIAVVAGFGKAILNNPAVEDFFLSLVTRHRHWIPAGFGLLALAMFLSFVAIARNPGGMKCPKCDKSISSRITMLTSNCGHCGEKIIA